MVLKCLMKHWDCVLPTLRMKTGRRDTCPEMLHAQDTVLQICTTKNVFKASF